jgi:nucleotide-binding universal stress UspA family protein
MILEVREILFPTDFSDVARQAGQTAAELARHFGARLHVLHVVGPASDPAPAPSALRDAVEALGAGLRSVEATASGSAAREIVAYAAPHGIDLIVIGTHGRTGVSRALLGSVAEAVIRRATCRVLTVPARLEAAIVTPTPPEPEKCVVCARPSDELICAPCRALIRGESLQRKFADERAGRLRGR